MTNLKFAVFICIFAARLRADGGATTVRSPNETIPAAGTVQVKFLLSQPRPITNGNFAFSTGGLTVDGISASGPNTDASGAALLTNGLAQIGILSPNATFGTDGYPIVTITMDLPASLPLGSQRAMSLDSLSVSTSAGPLLLSDPRPALITVGGSVSIRGVYPGGGTWPAGTVISIAGSGFGKGTSLTTHIPTGAPVLVSPNLLQVILQKPAAIDGTIFEVSNPDGSQDKFYSYLRGTLVAQPSQPLLQATEPIFSSVTHAAGTVIVPTLAGAQFAALGLQNPTPNPVTIQLRIAATGEAASLVLPSQARLLEDLSVLMGRTLFSGEIIQIAATAGIQVVAMTGDPGAVTITPFLPLF